MDTASDILQEAIRREELLKEVGKRAGFIPNEVYLGAMASAVLTRRIASLMLELDAEIKKKAVAKRKNKKK